MDLFELAEPSRLWWLALLPVLYLLSRPPRPQKEQMTAYLALWLAARDKTRRRPIRFRWWRFLLLVLAFSTVVLAHTGMRTAGRPGVTDVVVLVDASASMLARTTDGATGWGRARAAVAAVLRAVPEHVDVRLGVCREGVAVVRGDRAALLRELSAMRPGGASSVDLAALAQQLHTETTAVCTVTDGLGAGGFPRVGSLVPVRARRDNVAITGCVIEDGWPMPAVRLVVDVQNFSDVERVAVLDVSGGVVAAPASSVRLAPGAKLQTTLERQRADGGEVTITMRLDGPTDALAVDDSVRVRLPPPPRPAVAVRAGPDAHDSLETAAKVLADEFGGKVVGPEDTAAGFLMVDGGELPALPAGARILSFGTRVPGTGAPLEAVRVLDWDRSAPLTAGLDLSELRVRRAQPFVAARGLQPLVQGVGGPLAVLRPGAKGACVHVGFRLGDSNFYKLAAFPQFVRRAFAACYGSDARAEVLGEPLLNAAESRLLPLAGPGEVGVARPLPAFSVPKERLVIPLLLAALLCLAIRAYV